MKKTKTLKLNRDFRRLYYRGKNIVCGYVIVYVLKNRFHINRFGITCSKNVGKAVVRNRIKRLIRESYRLSEKQLKCGYDIVIVARTRAVGKSFHAIKKDIRYAFGKLEMFEEYEKSFDFSD